MSHIGEIRSRVDALCAAAQVDSRLLQQFEQNPLAFLVSQGVHAIEPQPDVHPHSIHMCPWHTCQATRHHETPVQ